MPLGPGMRLGPYEVVAAIGAGGMGEVYRARDARLNRDVALKVLPELFAADPERLARFKREAQVLGALNHPNIAAIYGVEEQTDVTAGVSRTIHALVLELVEGLTLADRIVQGPLPLDEALPIARQIADALEAAHEQGIIHRDLKPANIKLRPDGAVKVLDFGLAKALDGDVAVAGAGLGSMSPTITSPAATRLGTILGTAAYMAPEQARGKAVDRRADIWAFGCVLYEMVTGTRAFEGEEVSDTLAAILRGDPDWSLVPAQLRRLARTCLEKDPRKRLQAIGDYRLLLDEAVGLAPRAHGRLGTRERVAWGVAALLGAALVAAAFVGPLQRRDQNPQAIRFTVDPPNEWAFGLPPNITGGLSALALSDDGRQLAFIARQKTGQPMLWVRRLDRLEAQALLGTEGASSPFWSPDGRFVAFFADGKLKKVDVSGGPPITLCPAPDNRGGSWSRDDVIVFAPTLTGALQKVSASGGTTAAATELMKSDPGHGRPHFLPDGRHFIYQFTGPAGSLQPIFVASLDNADRTRLFESSPGNIFYSAGHLLFKRETTLMAQPFDAVRLAISGDAVPIAEDIQTQGSVTLFAAAANGTLVFQSGVAAARSQLTWFDRSGKAIGTLGDVGEYWDVELSPDGRRAAVGLLDPSRHTRDLWIYDVAREVRTRFTFDPADETGPAWSPDGTKIAFRARSGETGKLYQLVLKPSGGAGTEEVLLESEPAKTPSAWSPDAKFLFFGMNAGQPGNNVWTIPLSGNRTPVAIGQGTHADGRPSPDGHWLVYDSGESGMDEIYVTRLPQADAKWQISMGGGNWPRWRANGREVFYLAPDNRLMAVDVTAGGDAFTIGAVRSLMQLHPATTVRYPYDVTADGQRILASNLLDDLSSNPLTLVVNWPAGLGK